MKQTSKKKHPKKTPREIAFHEAGHAVVGLALGYILTGAIIDPEIDRGTTGTIWLGKHLDPLCEGIVACAGAAAEGVDYLTDDHRTIRRFKFCERSFCTLMSFAAQFVAGYRPAVDAVADALETRRFLSGDAIRRIAFRACPSLRKEASRVPRAMRDTIRRNAPTFEMLRNMSCA